MIIADAKTFVVENPPPHFGGRYWVFIKLTTDNGIDGFGEAYSPPFHPHVVEKMILDVCERCVLGIDPFKIERLWRIIYSSGYTQRSCKYRHVAGFPSALGNHCGYISSVHI